MSPRSRGASLFACLFVLALMSALLFLGLLEEELRSLMSEERDIKQNKRTRRRDYAMDKK